MKKEIKDLRVNKSRISQKSILNALNHLEGLPSEFEISKSINTGEREKWIEVLNLSKSFGNGEKKKVVLDHISFDIYKNENVALLGGNGAGKTTLVEIMAGLNKPTCGEVKYLFKYKKSFQERIGIQFQDSSYPPAITVKEVIKFMIDIYGIKVNQDELNALIKIFGINEYYKKKASKLSGGQQQRLNVLLALIHKPNVIFLDELSTGLDISIRTRIKNFIRDFVNENKMTVILVSHDMDEIVQLCERVIFIKQGKIIFNDLIKNILKKHKSIEEFVFENL